MATTEDAIVDRVRTVLLQSLGFSEATGRDFSRSPIGAVEKRFVVSYMAGVPMGGFAYREEARGRIVIEIARATNNDSPGATRRLYKDARDVLHAVIYDASVTSGEYAIDDTDRALELTAPDGAAYQVARLTIGINFEASLV